MSRITDSIRLLGLIVTTKPFQYQNNEVTCNYATYVDISDLLDLKKTFLDEQQSLPEIATDAERLQLSDDIYFIDLIIENLNKVE